MKRTFFILILCTSKVFASDYTVGINGIHSSDLGLSGASVKIGQMEQMRPGDPGFDMPSNVSG